MVRHDKMARKKTAAKSREKKKLDEIKESVLVIQRRIARERPRPGYLVADPLALPPAPRPPRRWRR